MEIICTTFYKKGTRWEWETWEDSEQVKDELIKLFLDKGTSRLQTRMKIDRGYNGECVVTHYFSSTRKDEYQIRY